MNFFREEIGTVTYPFASAETYRRLLSRLSDLHLPVEQADEGTGQIIVKCTILFDYVLWRCWADRLLFELGAGPSQETSVSIFAIPNMLKIKVEPGENVTDKEELIMKLSTLS